MKSQRSRNQTDRIIRMLNQPFCLIELHLQNVLLGRDLKGLAELSDQVIGMIAKLFGNRSISEKGLKMGLWFEPEAVSTNSELAARHPEWLIHYDQPGIEPVEGRHKMLLNLALKDVQDHLIEMLRSFLKTGMISYIKWDMNRPMTDIRRQEQSHRYILGLYRILETITSEYPDLIIEGCTSGGSRLDAGILSYVNQNWASDNTDSWDRRSIQSGLSLFLPPQKLGAHVSVCPNHQTGRTTALEDRFETIRFFSPGYELNLSALSEEERKDIRHQVERLKQEREWMKQADFYQNEDLWAKVSKDGSKAEVLLFREHFDPKDAYRRIRFPWLDDDRIYQIRQLGISCSGEQLKESGLILPLVQRDFQVIPLTFESEPIQ